MSHVKMHLDTKPSYLFKDCAVHAELHQSVLKRNELRLYKAQQPKGTVGITDLSKQLAMQ